MKYRRITRRHKCEKCGQYFYVLVRQKGSKKYCPDCNYDLQEAERKRVETRDDFILSSLCQGKSVTEISKSLGLSRQRVNYLKNVLLPGIGRLK